MKIADFIVKGSLFYDEDPAIEINIEIFAVNDGVKAVLQAKLENAMKIAFDDEDEQLGEGENE